MTYDPEARRDTPLALKLKARIRRDGPITVAEYMDACLQDPEHGYYRTKSAIGAEGDFVTAPEISQVFGELIGLWCAVVWQQMGSPKKFNLVELGPGRGTLMADALRATRIVPGFHDAADVVLIESNAALRNEQARALASHARVRWGEGLLDLHGDAPAIVVGNEFLDTFAVEQFEIQGRFALPRMVGLDGAGRLCFTVNSAESTPLAPELVAACAGKDEPVILESARYPWVFELRRRLAGCNFALLLVDYGFTCGPSGHAPLGETVQAVRNHHYEHPLTSPGEADLTAHVDFTSLAHFCSTEIPAAEAATVDGPVTQANFLGSLGIMQRAAKLMSANPAKAHEIEAGVARLMAVPGMGDRFKAIGIRSANLPPLPGF